MQLNADQLSADRQQLPDFAAQRQHAPCNRRRNLDRGLVGHDIGERLVLGHVVAGLHVPGHQLDFGDAFAEVGHLDDVNVHGSTARLNAAATRAGPGK